MPAVRGKTYNLQSKLRSALRKLWLWSPMRQEALTRARVSYGMYRCQGCGGLYGPRDIAVDHLVSCTPPGGLTSWDEYIDRLFCPTDGLQILCQEKCHKEKTAQERATRKQAKCLSKAA